MDLEVVNGLLAGKLRGLVEGRNLQLKEGRNKKRQ